MITAGMQAGAEARLFLLFSMGGDRYALAAEEVMAIAPVLPVKRIAEAPPWVTGVSAWQGQAVPTLDLNLRAFGVATPQRTSTRLVIVAYAASPGQIAQPLGLILARATDTLRAAPSQFKAYGLKQDGTEYLGPVLELPTGLVQWIRVSQLLAPEVRQILYRECNEARA